MLWQNNKNEENKIPPQLLNNNHLKLSKILVIVEDEKYIPYYKCTLHRFNLRFCNIDHINTGANTLSLQSTDVCIFCCKKKLKSFYKLLKYIKSLEEKQVHTPSVIFIGKKQDINYINHAYKNGADLYLTKPFNNNVLIAEIQHLINIKSNYVENMKNKESFLAMVTHDLKTPVNASIMAFNLLMNNKVGESDKEEIMSQIFSSVKYSKLMIDNILTRSKIENGKLEIVKRPLCIKKLVENCIKQIEFLSKDKKQNIFLHCLQPEINVMADEMEMSRVILNLMSNAVEYAPFGTNIDIELYQNAKETHFSITNTGPGINLPNPNEVFDKYISYAKKHKKVGTGLGLYVAKETILAHGGCINVKSIANSYTTFEFSLPNGE